MQVRPIHHLESRPPTRLHQQFRSSACRAVSRQYSLYGVGATHDVRRSAYVFFAGYEFGHPIWITRQKWESGHNAAGEWTPPRGAEIFAAEPADERCVGEHSVTWNAPLHSWLLLYTCVPWVVEVSFAPEPWGPWSTPIILLSAVQDPGLNCTLIQNVSVTGCPGLTNEQMLPSGMPSETSGGL
jgi:hypothetical protein